MEFPRGRGRYWGRCCSLFLLMTTGFRFSDSTRKKRRDSMHRGKRDVAVCFVGACIAI